MAFNFRQKSEHIVITIESRTIIKIMVVVAATLLAMAMARNIVQPLILIAVSFFLALALNPAVSKISRLLRIKSRATATGIAYVLVLTFLIAFFALVIPPLVRQTVDFIKDVPSTIQDYKRDDSPVNNFVHKYNLEKQVDQFSSDFADRFKNVGKPVLDTAGVIGTTVAGTITVLVITFMMIVEGPMWLDRFWSIQDPKKRKHRRDIASRMYKVVTSYVNGQVLIAALGGFFASIILFILSQVFDASINPIALGGIISLFALLPLIGTTIGSVIVTIACLFVSAPLAIAFVVYFIIYQQIENVTIQPYIQARGNNLTPLIVFVAAIVGVGVAGIIGAFAAIPIAGCIKILVEDHFAQRENKTVKPA